jgi:hypothetical protein
VSVEVARLDGCADLGREQQSVLPPSAGGSVAFCSLESLMLAQRLAQAGRNRNVTL